MKILNHKDAINRRQDKGLIIVETAIYRVFWLNRTVLEFIESDRTKELKPVKKFFGAIACCF
ncbi:hypothetical protein [Nostoc sphaeroides]|uniref:Uncharacterized protein n=1 Tax=Nostoc sphaeroides CCNUC1 TaxID=2653204 RepID=A0A5P8VV75_9NOSO|nr:hypothetical protein [Nostoc sphaeroides]QFS44264.1 hypothetical protein GXM_01737 [Nostoc sphaeroides CCNUC1]